MQEERDTGIPDETGGGGKQAEAEKTEYDRRKEKAGSDDEPPRDGQGHDLTIPGTPANPDTPTR